MSSTLAPRLLTPLPPPSRRAYSTGAQYFEASELPHLAMRARKLILNNAKGRAKNCAQDKTDCAALAAKVVEEEKAQVAETAAAAAAAAARQERAVQRRKAPWSTG